MQCGRHNFQKKILCLMTMIYKAVLMLYATVIAFTENCFSNWMGK